MDRIKPIWDGLCQNYTTDFDLIQQLWLEIRKAYQGKGRHYHNLLHLENLLLQASQYQHLLQDVELLCFSIFYHDIIYSSLRKDNELKSAKRAHRRLAQLGLTKDKIRSICLQIEATQKHLIPAESNDPDLLYFLDFDLSILGTDTETYRLYTQQIRKEYRIYPGWMYRKGRRKALGHFLERERLFFTDAYYEKYEKIARDNLRWEISTLS